LDPAADAADSLAADSKAVVVAATKAVDVADSVAAASAAADRNLESPNKTN
jgi:hypothetical protein